MSSKLVVSAGLLIKADNKYLLVKPYGGTTGGWGIPKGKLDPGEGVFEAAAREVKEETGFDIYNGETILKYNLLVDRTPFFHYLVDTNDKKRGRYDKHVYAFMAYASGDIQEYEFVCNSFFEGKPEIVEFKWFTLDEAREIIVKSQRGLIDFLLAYNKINDEPST